MPGRCVLGGCSNFPDVKKGIVLHAIPFFCDDRPEATKRRKKWIDFVKVKREGWEPTKYSSICSLHFDKEDFMRRYTFVDDMTSSPIIPRLKKDDFGITAFPSIHAQSLVNSPVETESTKKRKRRMVLKNAKKRIRSFTTTAGSSQEPDEVFVDESTETTTYIYTASPDPIKENSTQTDPAECPDCTKLITRNRQLRNQLITVRGKLKQCRKKVNKLVKKHTDKDEPEIPPEPEVPQRDDDMSDMGETSDEDDDDESDVMEEEPDFSSDSYYDTETMTETETETENEEDNTGNRSGRVDQGDGSFRTRLKFIVDVAQLLLLFRFCHVCKADNPLITTRAVGTMAVIESRCQNERCPNKETIWKSQPNMPGTRIASGNFLLCLAILLSGGSASKVIQMFNHMGLSCFSLKTFFKHQREKLFPTIHLFWKLYHENVMIKLKALGEPLVMGGDGRHDSMGHCAKYGAYTMFCCTISSIVHFSLIQRNVAGNSPAMEFLGFKNCMEYLLGSGIIIGTLITDRHSSIRKYMNEKLQNITHYFDLWHIKKKIHKVLTKISKKSGGSALVEWIKPCVKQFYWSATSTESGNGNVIYAKFKAFLSHVINKHDNLDEPLFNKCAHREIQKRKWLDKGDKVYEKLHSALTNKHLVSGIKQVSPLAQTSCLEGFHSVLNHFAPKMIGYSFVGMYCRHIIAVTHFNINLYREVRKKSDGTEQVNIVWPKFKNGEATVREVRVLPKFDYVEDIYQTFLVEYGGEKFLKAIQELRDMTPEPMNTMLERESRLVAIPKRDARRAMTTQNVPPTTPVTEAAIQQPNSPKQSTRNKPHCSSCNQPMKGHKNVTNCPRNQMKDD